jgi:hypothetical protein
MSTEVKFRRGSTTQHATFTGSQGEVTVDTDLNTLRIHDGATVGGHRMLLHSEFVGSGTGTLTQIDSGAGLTGGPITASGTLALDSNTQITLTNSQTAYSWGDHATFSYLTNIISQNIGNLLNVNDTGVTDGQILQYQSNSTQYLPVDMPSGGGGGGGGSSVFTGLTDTPSNFTGEQYKILRVNTNEDALEFVENIGEINLASNKGAGEGQVFFAKDNATGDLQFRSIRAGTGMSITQTPNEITINAPSLTYSAGAGLDLNNNVFSIESGYVKTLGDFTIDGDIIFAGSTTFQQELTYGNQVIINHPPAVNKEIFFRGKISDALNDFVEMSNATTTTAQLSPCVRGGVESSTSIASMSVIGEVPTAKDTGLYPMMDFVVKKGGDVTDYSYGVEAAIAVRPLFDFKNYTTSVLTIKPTGTEIAAGLTVYGVTSIPYNLKFKNSFSLKSGLESAIDASTYPGCIGVASNELYFSATSNNGEWIKVAKETEVPSGVFYKVTADAGGTAEATSILDELTISGGTGIDTARAGNVITITNTGGGGGSGGSTQDLWATINADAGTATANSSLDILTISGGDDIATSISGDVITINSTLAPDVFKSFSVANNNTIMASGLEDTLTFVAGSNITIDTDATAQSITINSTATGGGGGGGVTTAFGTVSISGQSDVVADNSNAAGDTLTFVAGTGINLVTSNSADSITITNTSQVVSAFTTVAVSGQSDIISDSTSDTLTFEAGSNITLTTDAVNDKIIVTAQAITQDTYKNFAVTGQGTLTADQTADTVTFVEGTGITITTSSLNDTITFAAGDAAYESRTAAARTFFVATPVYDYEISNTYFAVDDIAVSGNNLGGGAAVSPTIYLIGGHTYAFELDCEGHAFVIKTGAGEGITGMQSAFNTGLRHLDTAGTWSYGQNAQGKVSGTLFWTVPQVISGNYIYQCLVHGNMFGTMVVIDVTTL